MTTTTLISVVVPVFDEASNLPGLLAHLRHFNFYELIFVDGGSSDGSWEWLKGIVETKGSENIVVQRSDSGRAQQMNAGAEVAQGDILLFVHADTRLPEQAVTEVNIGVARGTWGRFNVAFFEKDYWMAVVAYFINLRSKLTSVATGDQAIFTSKSMFKKAGGFENIPLMEDVALSKTLRKMMKPYCSKYKVVTSARRWLKHGRMKTIFLMWKLRWRYYRGVSPQELAREYRNAR